MPNQITIKIYLLALMLVCCMYSNAQSKLSDIHSNKKNKSILYQPNDLFVLIDSFGVDAQSFQIKDIDTSYYFINAYKGILYWKKSPTSILKDKYLEISYRTLNFNFSKAYFNKSTALINQNIAVGGNNDYKPSAKDGSFVDFNSLDYYGSYARSISLGNSQDVALNSQFNLQLNGYILDSVRVEAVISDNNIPFQPDGNTQKIQEFDKMYITFEKGKHKLTGGDYNIISNKNYLLKFNKRVQGIMYEGTTNKTNFIENKIGVSASIAKGQIARNSFNGSEGNQGPYKLTGNNGEQYFIVLAGSERVYIDSVLMTRGEDRDYVINYNTGEIKFTSRQLITKDKRIQVEFEYQDRNYLNSLLYVYDELNVGKKFKARFDIYSNQDAKNQNFSQSLNADQKQFLGGIGDNISQAYYPVIIQDTLAANKILYRIKDTVVNGVAYDSIYEYSTSPDSTLYSLSFSNVGFGKGNYIIAGINTNGRSYAWIPPINGLPQGEYEAVALLITPKKHQFYSSELAYQIDSNKRIVVTLGASNYSANTFSQLDNQDDWGYASHVLYQEKRNLSKVDSNLNSKFKLLNTLSYEYVEQNFKSINIYRNVEFVRDWSMDSLKPKSDEHLVDFKSQLLFDTKLDLNYNLKYFNRINQYEAQNHIIGLNYKNKHLSTFLVFNQLMGSDALINTRFFRPNARVEYTLPKKLSGFLLGGYYQMEDNQKRTILDDSLQYNSYKFTNKEFYLRSPQESILPFELKYINRIDYQIQANNFQKTTNGNTFEAKLGLRQQANHQLNIIGSYRTLSIYDGYLGQDIAGSTMLSRIQYNGNITDGLLTPTILYEIGTGQEQKREYTFVEVPAGQGQYMWNDYNNDGIQQANEFEFAMYEDQKKFIKVATTTNDYVKVNYLNLNASIGINPDNYFKKHKSNLIIVKYISKLNNQFTANISNRILTTDGFGVYNPFYNNFNPTAIIGKNVNLTNVFFINRNNSKWGADYTFSKSESKALLTYGVEGQDIIRHAERLRINFSRKISLVTILAEGNRSFLSPLDDGRNYEIKNWLIEPTFSILLNSDARLNLIYRHDQRNNLPKWGTEKARYDVGTVDFRYNFKRFGLVQSKFSYTKIVFDGTANSSIGYVLLDGLSKGNNLIWSLGIERKLGKGIELSIDYEGRKTGENNMIHTGRMSVRAIL